MYLCDKGISNPENVIYQDHNKTVLNNWLSVYSFQYNLHRPALKRYKRKRVKPHGDLSPSMKMVAIYEDS